MMAWRTLRITPLDTLFFREPRPFTAGQQTDARSLFPPTSLTMQGMLRSLILAHHAPQALSRRGALPPDVSTVIGQIGGAVGTLRLRGPWLVHGESWLLPAPLDLVMPAEAPGVAIQEARAFAPTHRDRTADTCSLPGRLRALVPPVGWTEFHAVGGWLSWPAFRQYLEGEPLQIERGVTWFEPSDLWVEELRPGIGIDEQRNRAKDSLLYFARPVRLQAGVSLGVEVGGLGDLSAPWKAPVFASLGGEGKAVVVEAATAPPPWRDYPARAAKSMKLVLTQPAWFTAGWHPSWMECEAGTATIGGRSCEWVGARVERSVRIGGWDLARRGPRPLRPFVPAGSIYYLDGVAADQWPMIWDASITESPAGADGLSERFDQIGFGHVLAGQWAYQEG